MLFAMTGMVESRVSGNLMSLGAIDFGLIIDGAVVMVENIIRHLAHKQKRAWAASSPPAERVQEVRYSAKEVANPMFFGVLIITVVYVPDSRADGHRGEDVPPDGAHRHLRAGRVAGAGADADAGAVLVFPARQNQGARQLAGALAQGDLHAAAQFRRCASGGWSLGAAVVLFGSSLLVFTRLGAEFIPQLDEGTMLLQFIRSSSAGLGASADLQKKSEKLLLEKFPEIERMFACIGTAEIAIDPMGPNVCDTYIELKPRSQWRKIDGRPATKEQLIELMRRELAVHVPGQALLFTQPIQMRFNEMMAGVRADIAVKVYGDDFKELERLATEIRDMLRQNSRQRRRGVRRLRTFAAAGNQARPRRAAPLQPAGRGYEPRHRHSAGGRGSRQRHRRQPAIPHRGAPRRKTLAAAWT